MKAGKYFLPLGGANEIGRNLNLFGIVEEDGYQEWIIIDAGVSIANKDGITLVMSSLEKYYDWNIIGVICTHAHDDHIGALPFIMKKLKAPIYATPFTSVLVRCKLDDHNVKADLREIPVNAKFSIGLFQIEMIYITHSTLEPNMILVHMGNKTILHTGDWKLDDEPMLGPTTDEKSLSILGDRGIDVLICDSTNALEPNKSESEGEAKRNLLKLISKYKDRNVFVSFFSSNLARLQSIKQIAQELGNKKVFLVGRSLQRMFQAAVKTGYMKESDFITNLNTQVPKNSIFVCTGSQGEENAVLQKLAYDLHRNIKINAGDVLIFSSRVIPGNDISISTLKNAFIGKGIEVIDTILLHNKNIHVSGHPGQPEIKRILDLTRPKLVIPVHGDFVHTHGLAYVAREYGYENVLIPHNGSLINLDIEEIVNSLPAETLCVDGNQLINLESNMLKTRKILGQNGVISISIINNDIQISFCGLFNSIVLNNKRAMKNIHNEIEKVLEERIVDCAGKIHSVISQHIRIVYGKTPLIIIHKHI